MMMDLKFLLILLGKKIFVENVSFRSRFGNSFGLERRRFSLR